MVTVRRFIGYLLGFLYLSSTAVLAGHGFPSNPNVDKLTVDRTSLSFDMTRAGKVGGTETVVVTNNGAVAVFLTETRLRGPHTEDFSLTHSARLPLVLRPRQSTSFQVTFSPLAAGERFSWIEIRQAPRSGSNRRIAATGAAFGPTGGELLLNTATSPYQDSQGEVWVPDFAISGETELRSTTLEIDETLEGPLFQEVRIGADFGYAFELPNGTYEVTLHFAETEETLPAMRILDAEVEDTQVIDDLDLVAFVGPLTAYSHTERTSLTDGVLNIDLAGVVGEAILSAIEVRSIPLLVADPMLIDFGTVEQGQLVEQTLRLSNLGLHDATTTLVSFMSTGEGDNHNADHDFFLEIGGQRFYGDQDDRSYALDIEVPALGEEEILVGFEPTEHTASHLLLRWEGNFDPLDVPLSGIGSEGVWGYLHPVIVHQPTLVVDYDEDGSETVILDGSESHTHEPGHSIVGWEWSWSGTAFSSTAQASRDFLPGDTQIELAITDDNLPPGTASDVVTIQVFAPDAVPGTLGYYYTATQGGATELLDDIPQAPDFIERLPGLSIPTASMVGGSPFAEDVMVRIVADFHVQAEDIYDFLVSGGVASRLKIDGQPWSGPQTLVAGPHSIEVRYAVDSLVDLPLVLSTTIAGNTSPGFDDGLTHGELDVSPLIHALPTSGIETGGNRIILEGFGFYPESEVIVHWGDEIDSPDLVWTDFTPYTADRVELVSPPSPGPPGVAHAITVTVETPAGVSNPKTFTYTPLGDVPIEFVELASVPVLEPTTGDWGPDGRLYVGSLSGEITAITFDESYNFISQETYLGVSGLTNSDTLGIAFDPYDPPGEVTIYVGHAQLWAHGGGPFTGPSEYSGQVSVLAGPDFDTPVPLISRLPTSNHDHGINGMQFDHNGDLLVCVGGNTNAGVRYPNMGDLPESPLSAALVKAETSRADFDGALGYVLSDGGDPNNDQVYGEEVDLAAGTHVGVYASGLRNTYDLVLSTWGYLYAADNGPNGGLGPASTGCNADGGGGGPDSSKDEVLLIEYDNYYGHPNRNRGRYDPRQCIYRDQTEPSIPTEFTQAIDLVTSAVGGITEYRAGTFGGKMRGELLIQRFGTRTRRVKLSDDKRWTVDDKALEPNTTALDVTTGPGGVVLAMDYLGDRVRVLSPVDAAAFGLTVYDIYPWRAPSTGGQRFEIGGEGLGTLGATGVTIGGVPAALTSVSSRRIVGVVPTGIGPEMELVDVEVQVGLDVETLSQAFMTLPPAPGQAPGFWRQGAPLPEPLGEVGGGIIDGILYLVGEGSVSDIKTYAYDILNDSWSDTPAERPFPGHHHSTEVVDDKLYLIGGLHEGNGKVQIFDPGAGPLGAWTTGADMPWPGGSVSTALIGGKIYAAGGIVSGSTVSDAAVYDPLLDSWYLIAPMATPINHAAAATDGEKFYVFGGRAGGNTAQPGLDTVQIYDPSTDEWDSSDEQFSGIEPLPSGRGGTGKAIYYRGEFYVMGGETSLANDPEADPDRVFAQVFAYDPMTNSWRQEARMPTARHGIYPLLFQSRIFVVGGGVEFGNSQSTVHEILSRP
jgi:glucose/arabinose dehydrogenase/N-acetylneuraminic acid mutarotase